MCEIEKYIFKIFMLEIVLKSINKVLKYFRHFYITTIKIIIFNRSCKKFLG